MKEKEITVSDLIKLIESGEKEKIQLRSWELAQLFGVYESAIRANAKAIICSGTVKPNVECEVRQDQKILLPEIFDLEMIVALVFRLHSSNADKLRKWIIKKISSRINVFGLNYQILN